MGELFLFIWVICWMFSAGAMLGDMGRPSSAIRGYVAMPIFMLVAWPFMIGLLVGRSLR